MSKIFLVPTSAKNSLLMARPALVDAAGVPLKLSDSQKEELQLGQSFASLRHITEACTAIQNTRFIAPSVKPDWFDSLNDKLDVMKGCADTWLNDYAVAVTSTIPSSIMTFVPVFDTSAKILWDIIQRNPDELPDSDAARACDILARMAAKVDEIAQKAARYATVDESGVTSGKLIDWQKDLRAAREALDTGSDSIQKACTDLQKDIAEFNGNIETLRAEISQYNKMVALGSALVGSGVGVSIVGLGFCFTFPPVGAVVSAVGIGMITGGGVLWSEMRKKISQANREIADFAAKINDDEKTIVSLNSLSTAAHLSIDSADAAISNLTDFAVTWVTFGQSLQATISALKQGGEEAHSALMGMDLDEAQQNWDDAKEYAKQLLAVPNEIEVVPAGKEVA